MNIHNGIDILFITETLLGAHDEKKIVKMPLSGFDVKLFSHQLRSREI